MTRALRCAYATDRGFAMQTAASIASLVAVAPAVDLELVVLHGGLDERTQSCLADAATGASIEFRAVDADRVRGASLPYYLGLPTLFRLLLPEVLPEWSEVLYLDADTVVLADPSELPALRDPSSLALAAIDPGLPRFGGPGGPPWRDLEVDPREPYFNAGVMAIDLDGWRSESVGRRCLDLLRAHRLPHGDQCALNTVMRGRIGRLPPIWNVTPPFFADHSPLLAEHGDAAVAAIRDDARILHFSTSDLGRPWLDGCRHPRRQDWFAAVERTPWRGFHPPRRTMPRRAFGAARRTVRRITGRG